MPKFRKKPVVIEAVQIDSRESRDSRGRPCGNDAAVQAFCPVARISPHGFVVPTLEGDHLARYGDWIIRGVKGEFYPCKPDIFAATYEPADAAPRAEDGERLVPWYSEDGSTVMLPAAEVERRRKLAAKVIAAARAVSAKVQRLQDALDRAPPVPGQTLLPREQRESPEHRDLRVALSALDASPTPTTKEK